MSTQPSAEPRLLYSRPEAARQLSVSVPSLDGTNQGRKRISNAILRAWHWMKKKWRSLKSSSR
jgi:hypothetical protein